MVLWAISGGAGFLGLHLARRLLADGHAVRTLDLAPLDDPSSSGSVEELRGDVRDPAPGARARRRRRRARPRRRRAADPRRRGTRSARSTSAARRRRWRPRSRRASGARSSSRRRRSTACPRCTRSARTRRSSASAPTASRRSTAERVCLEFARRGLDVVDRPAEDVHRSRAARRVRDPVRLGPRRPPHLRSSATGTNRYQLLAVEDLVDAVVLAAQATASPARRSTSARSEFGTVRSDLQALIDHAGSASRLTPGARAAGRDRAARARARPPLAARRVALQDGAPRLVRGRVEGRAAARLARAALERGGALRTYDWYLAHRDTLGRAGTTHRVPWNQQALALLKRLS